MCKLLVIENWRRCFTNCRGEYNYPFMFMNCCNFPWMWTKPIDWFSKRETLAARNKNRAVSINNTLLKSFDSAEDAYNSNDSVTYVEFLNQQNSLGIPLDILRIRIGTPIMLLWNLRPPKPCNGDFYWRRQRWSCFYTTNNLTTKCTLSV